MTDVPETDASFLAPVDASFLAPVSGVCVIGIREELLLTACENATPVIFETFHEKLSRTTGQSGDI